MKSVTELFNWLATIAAFFVFIISDFDKLGKAI